MLKTKPDRYLFLRWRPMVEAKCCQSQNVCLCVMKFASFELKIVEWYQSNVKTVNSNKKRTKTKRETNYVSQPIYKHNTSTRNTYDISKNKEIKGLKKRTKQLNIELNLKKTNKQASAEHFRFLVTMNGRYNIACVTRSIYSLHHHLHINHSSYQFHDLF